jgi:uncharacterized protein YggE
MNPITVTVRLPGPRVRWTSAGLITGLLVAATIAGPALAPRPSLAAGGTSDTEHTITVTGSGTVVVRPDIADVRLGVVVTKPTVKAARETAAEAMTRVIAALKKLGITDKDIQTTTVSLQPAYDYSTQTNPPKITGYNLANGVAVTIHNLDQTGDVIDDSLTAGATSLDGVTFRVDDPAKAQQQARTDAMNEAKANADTLAKAAGVSITGVASISEASTPVPYPVYYGVATGAPAADSVKTPVQPGTSDLTITVSVAYLIG